MQVIQILPIEGAKRGFHGGAEARDARGFVLIIDDNAGT
jgi:hypothetical protein